MKIQGRFIAILAVLGLLVALLPLATTGAVVGAVTLSGGEKGQYFSDQCDDANCYNIVEIEVEDSDLSPVRFGKGRAQTSPKLGKIDFTNTNYLVLGELIIAGEEPQTDRFDGGAGDNGDAKYDDKSNTDPIDDTWTFTLKDGRIARDSNDDAAVNEDDFTVRVNGSPLGSDTTSSEGYFKVKKDTLTGRGNGVTAVVITRKEPNDAAGSVEVTYEYSEYIFGDSSTDTPLNIAGSRVFYGASLSAVTNEAGVTGVDSAGSGLRTPDSSLGGAVEVTFAYHVLDEPKQLVTVTSTTSQGNSDVVLDGKETGERTSVFKSKVALVSSEEYNSIDNATDDEGLDTGDVVNRADGSKEITVEELSTWNNSQNAARILRLAKKVGLEKTDDSKKLLARVLPVNHGDTITVSYADASPATTVVRTAQVDMEAPVVTLVSPSDNLFTNEASVTLQAEVVDMGAGVERDDITMIASVGVNLPRKADQLKNPIGDGYRVTGVPSGAISQGGKKWALLVVDNVGNTPAEDDSGTDAQEGARGAAAPNTLIGDVDNPFAFTVDTSGPKLTGGKTGISLKNAGVTSGTNQEQEGMNNRESVRVTFDLGTGGAPLDAATVQATDFLVDGSESLDARVNVKGQECDEDGKNCKIAKGSAVYLQVGELETDARPKVELVGQIRDRSDNARTEGRVSSASDGLAPVLTVTTSAPVSAEDVTITVSSSERLSGSPEVKLTETMPDNGAKDLGEPLPITRQQGGITTWEAVQKVGNTAKRYYVVVTAEDTASNEVTVGEDKPDEEIIAFQVDALKPSLKFVDADGDDLATAKPEEGSVWIVAEFDEDEHPGDKYRKVEVTAVTLTNMDTDVGMLFGDEVDCVDHDTSSDRYDKGDENNDCAQWTLAVNLTPGMYNVAVTGVDQTGNEVKGNTDFEVTEAEPFKLTLRPGQNFISIPGMPMGDGGMLDNLFSDPAITAVSTYDRSLELQGANPWLRASKDLETGMFSGDITMIEPGKAYFVSSSASVTVEVKLQPPGELPPTIPVRQGYNAIGFWSISGADDAEIDLYLNSIGWSLAYSYDPTPGKGWEVIRKGELDSDDNPRNIEAGKGYLVYATYDAVLTP